MIEIINELQNVSFNSFNIKTNSVKAFKKDKKKKILYLGLEKSQDLVLLHRSVIKHLNTIGYNINNETYTPHITLIRRVEIENDAILNCDSEPFEISVNSFSIMESKRVDGELVYKELKRIKLKK